MDSIYIDSDVDDRVRRQSIYEGELFVFSARPSILALCEFARELIEEVVRFFRSSRSAAPPAGR